MLPVNRHGGAPSDGSQVRPSERGAVGAGGSNYFPASETLEFGPWCVRSASDPRPWAMRAWPTEDNE